MTADDETMDLKQQCVNLLFDCPHDRASNSCPFRDVRAMDVVERVRWLKSLGLEELKALTEHHLECCEKNS